MSLTTTNEPKQPRSIPTKPGQLSRKMRKALDLMAWQGMLFDVAARECDLSVQTMRSALGRPHVMAYLRSERQVFRASLVDEATFRMRELSRQDDNRAAAVTATSKLMSETDQDVTAASRQSVPGLVVIIETRAPAVHADAEASQVIDMTTVTATTPPRRLTES